MLLTLLPEPDSPTMPSVLPRSSLNDSPSTDLTTPSSVWKCTRRSSTSRKLRCCGGSHCSVMIPPPRREVRRRSLDTHPRVDDHVQNVHDQVGHDDEGGGQDGHAEHLRQV